MGEGLKRAFAAARSTRLPAKRTRPKMGVRESEQKIWPRHRRHVRSHGCCIPNCPYHDAVIDFAHVKTWGSGGQDWQAVSLCRVHHDEQHRTGIETFWAKYGIDPWPLAGAFVMTSPDTAMKEAMRALENA